MTDVQHARRRQSDTSNRFVYESLDDILPHPSPWRKRLFGEEIAQVERSHLEGQLSIPQLAALTAALAGAQLVWTVEQGYGTPFLLSLELSKQATALVWLAGPLSGLLAQPLIGALSDASRSRYKRRKFIVGSALIVFFSLLAVAYCRGVAGVLVDTFGIGIEGSWDPERDEVVRRIALYVAIPAFILLDVALNALQASSRALILDVAKHGQHITANAWQGRMTHAANVVGFSLGVLDLAHAPVLAWIPGGQFARLCILSLILLVLSVGITVYYTIEEEPEALVMRRKRNTWTIFVGAFEDVGRAMTSLPVPIRRVCYAQFLAWSGWFSFLFFASLFVAQHYLHRHPSTPNDSDLPARAGSFALLLYAIVALIAGTLLPLLQTLGASAWAMKRGEPMRRMLALPTPRNIWATSQLLFAILMIISLLVKTTAQATALIALAGVSWAVTCWVPFALVMQLIHEPDPLPEDEIDSTKEPSNYGSTLNTPVDSPFRASFPRDVFSPDTPARTQVNAALTECAPLVGRPKAERPGGATVLGIHNVAIVAPQFVTSLVASFIFRIAATRHEAYPRDVAYVFAFGGISALASVFAVRRIPPPSDELEYKERLRVGEGGETLSLSEDDEEEV